MKLNDSVVVVTGAGNGIGREVALQLLRAGARVAAVDLSEDGLAETARLAQGGSITTHAVDVGDLDQVEQLRDAVLAQHGHVDGLVNVAGIIQRFVPVRDLAISDVRRVMNVNFWGVVHTSTAFLPALLDRPAAALVNVSSMGALAPVPGQTAYGASKAAVKAFTEGLYAELRETNVAVTVVFPGAIATNIAGNSGAAIPGRDASSVDTSSLTSPQEAARQIVGALRTGPYRVRIGRDARMLDILARISPRRATEIIARKMASLVS